MKGAGIDGDVEMYGRLYIGLRAIEKSREFADLIPEVRSNFVYTRRNPRGPHDVLAVDGRITVRDGMPFAAGSLRFGASSHMARLLVELSKVDPAYRAGINFANDPPLAAWLARYCEEKGWIFSVIDRSREPEAVRGAEQASMPWKAAEAVRAAGGRVPKIFYETGAIGKEPVTVLVGSDPIEVAREMLEIARRYRAEKSPPPRVGKIDARIFETLVKTRLGRPDPSVIVPPRTGIDAGVIAIGGGRVLVVAEDPIFAVPGQPWEMFGWYTVHIGASDVAVMGVVPQYMTYTLLMPPGTPDAELTSIVDSIHRAADELGIAIVGGHTGYYPGLAAPTIGGVTVFAFAGQEEIVTPAGARPGDRVILTKGPAIEAAGLLAVLYEAELKKRQPIQLVERAKALVHQMTVVKDAAISRGAGRVTAMHDATEGGVMGGLAEIAEASGVGMEIDEKAMVYPEEVRIVCETLGIDPATAIAEGSLLVTVDHSDADAVVDALHAAGIAASVIGTVRADPARRTIRRRDGRIEPLAYPDIDPFWPVFFRCLEGPAG